MAKLFGGGIDARYAWQFPGGQGDNVNLIDVELAFDASHYELSGTVLDFADADCLPTFDLTDQHPVDHGTASSDRQ